MKTYDFGYTTIEGVVERVNTGAVQGFEHHTSEYLAASYAYDAAQEAGYTDSDSIAAHLEILADAGAEFDHNEALLIATGKLLELDGRWVSRDAAVNLMDDELREMIHADADIESEQIFLDRYVGAHREKFGEEFSVS